MTKDELLYQRIFDALSGDMDLVRAGVRSPDVLGTLKVNRDVAAKLWPDCFIMGSLVAAADALLKESEARELLSPKAKA
jgi:hypothetical protein